MGAGADCTTVPCCFGSGSSAEYFCDPLAAGGFTCVTPNTCVDVGYGCTMDGCCPSAPHGCVHSSQGYFCE